MARKSGALLLLLIFAATAIPALANEIRGLEILRHPDTGQEVVAIWNGEPGNFYCVPADNVVLIVDNTAEIPSWVPGPGELVTIRARRTFIEHIPKVITPDLSCS